MGLRLSVFSLLLQLSSGLGHFLSEHLDLILSFKDTSLYVVLFAADDRHLMLDIREIPGLTLH
jgi:hypothetical protein